MPERTNNIPPMFQQLVLDAIEASLQRRIQLEADGTLMDFSALMEEVYKQVYAKMKASGTDPEEFIPEHRVYMAQNMTRIMAWALAFSKEYPPTHRKGYGEQGYEEIVSPVPMIFYFGGGGNGGPHDGPGNTDWPLPEDWEPEDFGGGPVPDFGGLVNSWWQTLNMDHLQQQAFMRGGKAGIQQLQIHFTREVALDLIDRGEDAYLEYYHNPIPGTNIFLEPAIILLDGYGPTQSCKVIGGRSSDNWTFGHPQWFVGGLPNPEDRIDPRTVDLGPSPF